VPPFLTVVGLFVNARADAITQVIESVPLDLLQFHGDEVNDDCGRYGLPFIKAIPMKPGADLRARFSEYPESRGFLLDTWQPDSHGGGGQPFNWDAIPMDLPAPVILAGGLSADNVAAAVRQVKPYAVDVSSGVEFEKGMKSAEKMAAFVKAVRYGGREVKAG
jgi:phosphoribosylanthranilate isomerase